MAVTGTRSVTVTYSGDISGSNIFSAANNAASPATIEIRALAAGTNTLTPPAGSTACTIVPPSGNVNALTLKGIAGDTGVPIHKTDPTSIGLDSAAAFVITAGGAVSVRFIWT